MGLLTDFFIAGPEDLENLNPQSLADDFPAVLAKRVDPVKLATLASIVLNIGFDDAMERVGNSMVREFGEDGPWVLRLEDDLMKALAGLTAQQVDEYAAKWASTEEWRLDRGTPDELSPLLQRISELSARALEEGKNVYLLVDL